MPIAINGSGTITGISAGGLPDGVITNDDLAGSIADAKLSGTTCKAWVNFNGTGTVAIRASYNVSSITDHAVGQYTVNFTTAMVDASYALVVGGGTGRVAGSGVVFGGIAQAAPTASAARISVFQQTPTAFDPEDCHVAIFR